MNLRHLQIFKTVYEKRNMTMAAETLYISQPSVSQVIKELENSFEVCLFERYAKKLYPTAEGELLYKRATKILEMCDEMEKEMKNLAGRVVISIGANITAGTALITRFIRIFNEMYPEVKVHVKISGSAKLKQMLRDHVIEFALMEDIIGDTNLVQEPFYKDRIVFVCSPESIYAKKRKIKFTDLASVDFLLREKGAGVREQFDYLMNLNGIEVDPAWESSNNRALINAVKNNYGIAVMPYLLVREELETGSLWELNMDEVLLNRNLNIVYTKDKYFNKWSRHLIDVIKSDSEKLFSDIN